MSYYKSATAAILVALAGAGVCAPSFAQAAPVQPVSIERVQDLPGGDFVKKSKKLKGSYEVVQRGAKTFIVFSDDFRAANGPDLKIFLSPKSVSAATGKNATEGALNIGKLKSTKGVQEYEVPAGVNLADYGSVLVHCEAYSVLWGGSNL
ncbi:DM13 domain-containing protein [Hyphomonas sp. FCG-A18]|uniref:DM13 domain-containing protein n=1 Tax=Hyphomonas sp. FCG-A18 TaxID=3080019 RepID=UPI002B287217|nr:DM13 domain-containing protein [Hyphomonas sp. FCG-A18]